jgi:hypothetical protein
VPQEQTNGQRFARRHRQTKELKLYESGTNAAVNVGRAFGWPAVDTTRLISPRRHDVWLSSVGFKRLFRGKIITVLNYFSTIAGCLVYSCCSHLEHRASVKRFVSLQFLNLWHSVGFLGRVISPSQGRYLTQTDINASSGIRTHYPSVRESEDSSCLRPRGHCDRLSTIAWRHMETWKYSSTILDLGIRLMWVISFTTLPLYPRGKEPQVPIV